jgi:beta-aspartyl-peptidase (threonine type)
MRISFGIHGGAGTWATNNLQRAQLYLNSVADYSINMLAEGAEASEVIVSSLANLENSGIFNAGCGSYPQADGKVRMDAGIMMNNLSAGGIIGLENNLHAINVANDIRIKHDKGEMKSILLHNPCSATSHQDIYKSNLCCKPYRDTVGAVALDINGRIAVGTSTGGIGKEGDAGRIGDSGIMGSGYYAMNKGGAVCTGIGEYFLLTCPAFVTCEYINSGISANLACSKTIKYMENTFKKQDLGGILAIDVYGNVGAAWDSRDMPYAARIARI